MTDQKSRGAAQADTKKTFTDRIRGFFASKGEEGMGTKFLFRLTALAVAMAMVVLGAGVAWADLVVNDVTTANETVSIANGGSANVSFQILNENNNAGDSINRCNAGDGTAAIVTINAPSGVTATPTSLSFTQCDVLKSVAFTSTTGGTHSITISVSDSGGGSYTTTGAAFTLSVAQPACTAASVTNPASQSVAYGDDATFSVTASGSPTPSVQWQSRSDSAATWTDVANATSSELTLTKPAVSASGSEYRAVATNSCGGTKTATSSGATLTVAKRAIEVAADAQSKTYGHSDPDLTYGVTAGSLVTGDSFSGALTRESGENVGEYAISQGALTAGNNYALTFESNRLTINKRPITITADAKSKAYGASEPAFTYAVTAGSLVTGDSFTGQLSRDPGERVASYPIRQGTVSAGSNYDLTYRGADLTIERVVLRVNAANDSKVYGASNPTPQWSLSGFVTGEDATSAGVAGAPSCSVTTSSDNVGTYTEAITCEPGILAADNYRFETGNKGTLTITPKPITVTADAQSKTYGTADPDLTYQAAAGSLESGDAFTGSLTRIAGEDVGTYAIQQGTLSAGDNYDISFTGANLTITAKPITVTAHNKSKVWGEQDPALTYSVSQNGLVGSDAFTGGLVRDAGSTVGSYPIRQGTLTAGTNYQITYVGATLTITPAFRLSGLYSPVDAQPTLNTVKGGSTVPLKFEVFAGTVEQKDVSVVNPLLTKKKTCGTNASDSIEVTSTGGTALRFDTTGDQFVYNWQTPKTPGACYTATVELADGSQVSADFQMK